MRRRVSNKNKLHRRLADVELLRIHRVVHADTRCVICATAIVDLNDRRVHLKENPTLQERMDDPGHTNGTPMCRQYWLQEGPNGKIIGPCGEACGGRAVVGSWTKEKRDKMRQDLLAAGVPKDEIEDRLEQAALPEWRAMLSVYRRAEREAQKLKIETNSLTFDEINAAVEWEKRWRNFEYAYRRAEGLGLKVEFATGIKAETPPKGGAVYPPVTVNGVMCLWPQDVHTVITNWRKDQEEAAHKAAQAARAQKRVKYLNHAEFIDWALASVASGANAMHLGYSARQELENALYYIEHDTVYPATLEAVERTARAARSWTQPWTGTWPTQPQAQPQAPLVPVANFGVPTCPVCGGELVRKTGTSKRGYHYDFYGCGNWKQTRCSGSMEVKEYEQKVGMLGGQQPQPAPAPVVSVVAGSKAVAAAKALLQSQPVAVSVTPPSPPEPESAQKHIRARRKRAFWNT